MFRLANSYLSEYLGTRILLPSQSIQYIYNHIILNNILRVLRGYRKDGPLSIGFLKERMLDKNSDVSRIVDKLHAKAYVDRKENPDDRRQKEIEITEKGMDLLATMDDCDRKTETLLENLNPEEVMELNILLDKIRSN